MPGDRGWGQIYAPWCLHSARLLQLLDRMAPHLPGLRLYACDTGHRPFPADLHKHLGLYAYPSLYALHGAAPPRRFPGDAMSVDGLAEFIGNATGAPWPPARRRIAR